MTGFSGLLNKNKAASDAARYEHSFAARNDRFPGDNINAENERFIVMLEGCVLNLTTLLSEYQVSSPFDLIVKLREKKVENIASILRGTYLLSVYDKQDGSLFVSNDMISKRPLYYFDDNEIFAYSGSFNILAGELKKRGKVLTVDKLTVSMMLNENILFSDETYADEIKYLSIYRFINVQNNRLILTEDKPDLSYFTDSKETLIDEFDKLFSDAVSMQYKKNEEAGYKQLSSISGGLDSRSCLLKAISLGYKNMNCYTYAQSGSADHSISKQITEEYGLSFNYLPLDNANFFFLDKEICALNESEQYYLGSTGAYDVFHNMKNHGDYGIVHSGLLGGEIMGDVIHPPFEIKPHFTPAFESAKFIPGGAYRERLDNFVNRYETYSDMFIGIHTRACQNLMRMGSDRFEVFSPFLDEKLYVFILKLPEEMRYKRRFYIEWMKKYIPCKIKTTFTKTTIYASDAKVFCCKAANRIRAKIIGRNVYDMNPLLLYGKTVPGLNEYLDKTYNALLKDCDIRDKEIVNAFKITSEKNNIGKASAITALHALSQVLSPKG